MNHVHWPRKQSLLIAVTKSVPFVEEMNYKILCKISFSMVILSHVYSYILFGHLISVQTQVSVLLCNHSLPIDVALNHQKSRAAYALTGPSERNSM